MAYFIDAKDSKELWQKVTMLLSKEAKEENSRCGTAKELLHVLMQLREPKQKWIYNRVPPINVSFALAELFWILRGSDNKQIIDTWSVHYKDFASDPNSDIYYGAYGFRLRNNFRIDQIERAYRALKENPNNRQTVMIIWDPKKDMPDDIQGLPRSNDIPCNICSLLKIREHKLEWTQIMRSNDLFRGLPYNLVQFTSIQEILAGWLEVEVGSYNHYSDSLHFYEYDGAINSVETNISLFNNDALSIKYDEFQDIANEIYCRIETLAFSKDLNEEQLIRIATLNSQNQNYNNIMFLIAAYPIRQKFHNKYLAEKVVSNCTNELYKHMWIAWVENYGNK